MLTLHRFPAFFAFFGSPRRATIVFQGVLRRRECVEVVRRGLNARTAPAVRFRAMAGVRVAALAVPDRQQSDAVPAAAAHCDRFFQRIDGRLDEPGNVRIAEHRRLPGRNHNVVGRVAVVRQRRGPNVAALKVKHLSVGLNELRPVADVEDDLLIIHRSDTPLRRAPSLEKLVDQLQHSRVPDFHEADADLLGRGGSVLRHHQLFK